MSRYDEQYTVEEHLFGKPYPELVGFVNALDTRGNALDLGCGQGRDVLMLAAQGFRVTGVDESEIGISQMLQRASTRGLAVTGIVGDIFEFEFPEDYDMIVLDSILHFGKDRARERELLDRAFSHTKAGGHVLIFIHRSRAKEKHLKTQLSTLGDDWQVVEARYLDYVYEESQTDFRSNFQFNMVALRKRKAGAPTPDDQGKSRRDRPQSIAESASRN